MLQSQSIYNNENALIICIIKYKLYMNLFLKKKTYVPTFCYINLHFHVTQI